MRSGCVYGAYYGRSTQPGASIPPETMMHFPPVSDFPPISEKFSDFLNFFYNFTFSEKFLHFHPPKFLMTFFLVIDHKFRISPLFSLFQYIPPCFAKIILSPYFYKFPPPVLDKFTCFLHTLRVFCSPYFDHDAFMHHPMHVLDAPPTMLHSATN